MTKRSADNMLLLLDAASLYFRAFYGVPETITAPDGTPVNAIRGIMDFIANLVADGRPGRVIACLDADWRPAFRVAALPSYKAHRVGQFDGLDEPATLTTQVKIIEDVLEAVGLCRLGVPGYEADDVIGTLAARDPGPVDVVTGDRDLFQVVDDSRGVRVLYTARGVGRRETVDEAAVTAKYGIPGRAYADFAVFRGDASDGLPGVAGIGEKSAAWLVSTYGSLEGVLAALDDPASGLPSGVRRKLAAARNYLDVAPQVVRVRTDLPVSAELDAGVPKTPRDPEAFVDLVDRWGLSGSADRLLRALAGPSSS